MPVDVMVGSTVPTSSSLMWKLMVDVEDMD